MDGLAVRPLMRGFEEGIGMTTTVKIEAHLATTKEVRVKITDAGNTIEEFALQDGEKAERYVYDGRGISVVEAEK